ncbi:MAG TPA: hypothetical protein PK948_12340 [Gemmatimonadales bacterium]|nr:hypothetical protein [Gemmatimonadales bacterium]
MWRCRWLGTIAVEHSDGRTDGARLLGQPKRLAILAYLTLPVPGTWHQRTTLLRLFYPDRTPAQGRNALRNALHSLRTTLGESVLLTRGDEAVSISSSELATDVAELTSSVARAGGAQSLPREPAVLLPDLESLVDGAGFHAWLEAERRRLATSGSVRIPPPPSPQPLAAWKSATYLGVAGVAALLVLLLLGGLGTVGRRPRVPEATPNPESARLVAAALHELGREEQDALIRAKALYLRAVDADPTYGPAFTGLGRTWMYLANVGRVPREQAVRMMRDALAHAARFSDSLDPDLLDGRAYLAYVDGDAAEAERLNRLAIGRAPGRAEFHEHLAHKLGLEGRLEESRAHYDTAALLAPLERRFPESAAYVEGCRGNDLEAVRLLKASLAIDSNYSRAWAGLVLEYARLARWSDAIEAWRRSDSVAARAFVKPAGADSATFVTSWAAFQGALRASANHEGVESRSPLGQVLAFANRGESDSALGALGRLRSQDPLALGYALCAWALRPLRVDPRFAQAYRGTRFEGAFTRVAGLTPGN